MDAKFREMLIESEKIRKQCRRTGNIGPHAKQMMEMISYGEKKGILTGNVFGGDASEELLAQTAEMAACVLEVIHGESVGSVVALSREQQMRSITFAKERAERDIVAMGRHGVL